MCKNSGNVCKFSLDIAGCVEITILEKVMITSQLKNNVLFLLYIFLYILNVDEIKVTISVVQPNIVGYEFSNKNIAVSHNVNSFNDM